MKEILNFLERKDLRKITTSYSNKPLGLPFELLPKDFIKFAEEDLNNNDNKSLINSLSNIKRAIDCRVESLLYLFGFYEKSKNENWAFPKKMDLLSKVGVIAQRILKKVNRKRNELEHDFKKPSRENVEDFFDVANLFLYYTERLVSYTYDQEFEWYCGDEEPWLRIKLNKGNFDLELRSRKGEGKKIKVSIDDGDNYLKILKGWVLCILE